MNHRIELRIKRLEQDLKTLERLDPFMTMANEALGLDPQEDKRGHVNVAYSDDYLAIFMTYDRMFAAGDDLRALHMAGFYQKEEYKSSHDRSNGTSIYQLFHDDWREGEFKAAMLYAELGHEGTCRRVKVGERTEVHEIFEVVCS
jgi:hypothetical protein